MAAKSEKLMTVGLRIRMISNNTTDGLKTDRY